MFDALKGQKLLSEFEAVMQENINSMKITEKKQWWGQRRDLNTQLEVSVSFILSCFCCDCQVASGFVLVQKNLFILLLHFVKPVSQTL